jgi:hypothetical protein
MLANAPDLRSVGAPKLSPCATGIESERYDFDKISFEPEAHQPLAEVTFFLGDCVKSNYFRCTILKM